MSSSDRNEQKKSVSLAVQTLLAAADVGRPLTSVFSEFIDVTSQLPVAKLEYWERIFRQEIGIAAQPRYRFGLRLFQNRRDRPLIPWLDCCSYDGYRRDRSLQALDEGAPNSFLLAMLLRRLNDWVPEVRAVARDRIPVVVEKTEPRYVLDALWGILPYLHTWGRLQADDMTVLIDILGIDDIPLQFSTKLISMTAGPAPAILAQMERQPAFDRFLPKLSEAAVQPAVRARAYRSQLDGYTVWTGDYRQSCINERWHSEKYSPTVNRREISLNRSFIEILTAAAKDRSPLVRRVAGNALFKESDGLRAGTVPIARMLAKDVSPSVAERGMFALKRLEERAG